jgi:hypothetical protein
VPSGSAAPTSKHDTEKSYATCIQRITEGKKPPKLSEKFPTRGLSGHAATLEVTVDHLKGEEVLPGGFRITDGDARSALEAAYFFLPDPKGEAAPSVERTKQGTSTTVKVALVPLPKEPGRQTLELPPLPITIARANGEVITVCTRPHELVLEDPIANTPDPKPKPNPVPRRQLEEWVLLKQLVIGGLVALVVGMLAAWAISRWRRRPRPAKPGPPPRPPWEVALEELHDIRHAGLIKAHRYSEHFDRVSDTIRKYLGDRYDFDGLESTTREALALLGAMTPLPQPLDRIKAFLRQADLVKFANLTPTEEDCEQALARGEEIVRSTRPVAPPAAPAKDREVSEPADGGPA